MPLATLTAKNLRTLPAIGGRRTDYRDTVCPGLELRVSPLGARTFAVVYGRGRSHGRITLGPIAGKKLKAVRQQARRLRARAALGEDPAREIAEKKRAPEPLSLEEVARRFMKEQARQAALGRGLRPRTKSEYRRLIDVEILPKLGKRPAAAVTRQEIRELVRAIEPRAPIVANRTFEMVRRLYTWAVSEDLVIGSPTVGMRRPAPEEPSDRVLNREELRALQLALDELPSQASDVLRLLLLTGVRLRMALGARRSEFHDLGEPRGARWVIPGGYQGRSKNRRPHVVPLSPAAVGVVRRRLEAWKGELLFPNRVNPGCPAVWQSSYVERLRRRLQKHVNAPRLERKEPVLRIPDWTVHQLRHTVRTHLREDLRVADDVAELIAGHVRRGVLSTYNRSQLLEERRAALIAWGEWLARVKAERAAKVLPWTGAREASRSLWSTSW
jgi:integrase